MDRRLGGRTRAAALRSPGAKKPARTGATRRMVRLAAARRPERRAHGARHLRPHQNRIKARWNAGTAANRPRNLEGGIGDPSRSRWRRAERLAQPPPRRPRGSTRDRRSRRDVARHFLLLSSDVNDPRYRVSWDQRQRLADQTEIHIEGKRVERTRGWAPAHDGSPNFPKIGEPGTDFRFLVQLSRRCRSAPSTISGRGRGRTRAALRVSRPTAAKGAGGRRQPRRGGAEADNAARGPPAPASATMIRLAVRSGCNAAFWDRSVPSRPA